MMYSEFSRTGCLILENSSLEGFDISNSLAAVCRHFGAPIFHKLSDSNGVHPVKTIPGYPEYANTTNADLQLHTDGSFELNAPKVFFLYCETPADEGGYTRLCFAKHIYRHVVHHHPHMLKGLFRKDAMTICRDDRKAVKPVFNNVNGRLHMTFRTGSDISIIIHPEALAGYRAIERYISDSLNCMEFKLRPNQALILDNTRVLHGRTPFHSTQPRMLHGLWCDGTLVANHMFSLGFEPSDDAVLNISY